MIKVQDFIDYLEGCVERHDIYVWGAQGQNVVDILYNIPLMAQTTEKAVSALKYISDGVKAGYDMMNAKAFDCSGLIVYYLMLKGILKADTTAAGLYEKCPSHPSLAELKPGDFVLEEKLNHIGTYIGNGKTIEARGHKYGVVITELSKRNWTKAARPDWYLEEVAPLTRKLQYKKGVATMTGEDVKAVQRALTEQGYPCGDIDGRYGPKTANAVTDFQTDKILKNIKYGIVDEKTAKALGLIWNKK